MAGKMDQSMETRLALVEKQIERYVDQGWVKDFVQPIRDSVTKIELSVGSVTNNLDKLFAAHNAMLEQQAADDKRKREESTPLGLVKKYTPLLIFVTASIAVFRVLGTLMEIWLRSRGIN